MLGLLRLTLLAGLLTVALAVAALAQSGAPAPGCAGVQISDPAGDATSASGDVTDVFFNTVGTKTTVNIKVKELGTPSDGALGAQIRWYVVWTLGDAGKFVRGGTDNTFAYGSLSDTGYSTEGTTTGKFYSGPDGIIEILIPGGIAGKGKKLDSPYVVVERAIAHPAGAAFAPGDVDRAPDGEGGKTYTVQPCGGDPVTPPPSPKQEQTLQKGALQVKAPKSAKAAKSVALKLSSPGKVTNLEGTFKKGSKTVGTGKLASMDKKGKLRLKLSKKPKKGSYTLYLLGTNPDGTRADKTYKIKLK